MPNSNSQSYRLINGSCLKRSNDQIKADYRSNKKYCKQQGLSPTTSKNTGLNSYRKKLKEDKNIQRNVSNKRVRFKSVSPANKQEGGFRKRKYNKTKKYSKKNKKSNKKTNKKSNKKHNKKYSRKLKK